MKKYTALLLAFIFVISSISFVSCNNNEEETVETDITTDAEVVENVEETTDIVIASNREPIYNLLVNTSH